MKGSLTSLAQSASQVNVRWYKPTYNDTSILPSLLAPFSSLRTAFIDSCCITARVRTPPRLADPAPISLPFSLSHGRVDPARALARAVLRGRFGDAVEKEVTDYRADGEEEDDVCCVGEHGKIRQRDE